MTIQDKILSFKNFQEGWCYGEGIPFKNSIIEKALILADKVDITNYKVKAFPGINSEIQLIISQGIRYLEITIEFDELISAVCEVFDKELFYKEKLTLEQATKEIINFCKYKNESLK
jgi:hypothetical protein